MPHVGTVMPSRFLTTLWPTKVAAQPDPLCRNNFLRRRRQQRQQHQYPTAALTIQTHLRVCGLSEHLHVVVIVVGVDAGVGTGFRSRRRRRSPIPFRFSVFILFALRALRVYGLQTGAGRRKWNLLRRWLHFHFTIEWAARSLTCSAFQYQQPHA